MTPVVVTPAFIAAATGGEVLEGDPGRTLTGLAIDSRTLAAGDLFVAIVAARDGHRFVPDALARGAAGVVIGAGRPVPADVGRPIVIRVADTTRALQDVARAVRRASGARVVAITGSAGKTTTKEAVASVLAARYRVLRNRGNLNNHLGLPLSLLELRHGTAEIAVMELGMNHAGEIRVLAGVAEPDVRVWTNVGDAHIGHFGSADAIADAKAEILDGARAGDLLVCNADDARVMARVQGFEGRVVSFGTSRAAIVRAVDIEDRGLRGTAATVMTPAGSAALRVPLPGRANLSNALAAVATGTALGVPVDEAVVRIAGLAPAPGRGAVTRLSSGITVVDDSYNSSPSALAHALGVLGAEPASRRVAVLGEMLELGDQAMALHEASGERAAAANLALLVTVGGDAARALAGAAVEAGMDPARVVSVATSAEAADRVASWLEAGDVVLVKGSRGTRTDVVVARILAERG